jgi:hypothetical protein
VSIQAGGDDPAVMMVPLRAPSWEFHFWAHLSELARLRSIREADWSARRPLQIGEAGGIPVHWCINDDIVSALIGQDDEAWHIAFLMPVDTIDRLAAEAVDLLPPPDPDQLEFLKRVATVGRRSIRGRRSSTRSCIWCGRVALSAGGLPPWQAVDWHFGRWQDTGVAEKLPCGSERGSSSPPAS